jgi:hypothetical protein
MNSFFTQSIQIFLPHREQVYAGLIDIIRYSSGSWVRPITAPAGRTSSPHAMHRFPGDSPENNLLIESNIPIFITTEVV